MLKFKVDENLPARAADVLVRAGHDAISVLDQKLGGEADDQIAAVCKNEERTIVTLDLDFADIRHYPPADYHGLIVLRLVRQDRQHVLDVLNRLLPTLKNEPILGRLWIVNESSVRIRE